MPPESAICLSHLMALTSPGIKGKKPSWLKLCQSKVALKREGKEGKIVRPPECKIKMWIIGAQDTAQLADSSLEMQKAWVQPSALHKVGMARHPCSQERVGEGPEQNTKNE